MPKKERLSKGKYLAKLQDQLGPLTDMFGDARAILGQGLKRLRQSHHQTLDDWSQLTGINQSVLSRIELDRNGPYLERGELVAIGMLIGDRDGMDEVMINAGYLPSLSSSLEKFLKNRANLFIMARAIREMTGQRPREGYIEIIQSVASEKQI